MNVCVVVGARPNYMKMGPVVLELARRGIGHTLVHTGQHYDERMSEVFFRELGMPEPDVDLGVGSGSHAHQTARVMAAFERVCLENRFELVMVGGDVNSTLAAALVAAKLLIPVAHVEAGLRSFDRTMPEEVNRLVTDQLSDLLFTTEAGAGANLAREGVPPGRIHFVGNCMVDSLVKHCEAALAREPWKGYGLGEEGYALLTLHRPSNVDGGETLRRIVGAINELSVNLPVVFPVHPRTRERMHSLDVQTAAGVRLTDPLPYLEFLGLMSRARLVVTDSGGIQEETTVLGVPCLTVRENTERPVTVERGTNRLVGTDPGALLAAAGEVLQGRWPTGVVPDLWDGRAAERVVDVVESWMEAKA